MSPKFSNFKVCYVIKKFGNHWFRFHEEKNGDPHMWACKMIDFIMKNYNIISLSSKIGVQAMIHLSVPSEQN